MFAAAFAAVLIVQPVLAQSTQTDPELEALIPDSAVANPDEFARPQVPPPSEAPIVIDPAAPLADGAGFTLPWPELDLGLPAMASLEPDPDIAAVQAALASLPSDPAPQGDVTRLSSRLTLAFPSDPQQFPEREEFEKRFKGLSTLESLGGGEDTDVADGAELEQVAIAGNDEGGFSGERAGEDLIVIGITRDAR